MNFRMEQHDDEIFPFFEWLKATVHGGAALEVGIRYGGTCALWSTYFASVVGIDLPDPAVPNPVEIYMGLRGYKNIEVIVGDSHAPETLAQVPAGVYDFIFLDGDHSLEGVALDFSNFAPRVRKGGVIAFHDITANVETRHGHGVPAFWRSLKGDKHEWDTRQDWGGIGALVL